MEKKWTIQEIKAVHEERAIGGHFFSRDTMRFFKDTMKNLGVTQNEDGVFIFRKKGISAYWKFNTETGAISGATEDIKKKHGWQ